MKKVLLQGRDICKSFAQNGETIPILNKVNMEVYEGDFTVIMGASGAGKSTLLYALSGMDSITSGEIEYRGKRISGLTEKEMARIRAKEFGFVFQQTHLVSNLTLFENIVVAGYVGGGRPRDVQQRASELLSRMHVDGAKDRLPSQTSGGEAQRAAIARAMIQGPGLIFADEPTGALNKSNSEEVLNLLSTLNSDGQSLLMVTHDVRAAIRGNRILYLEDGKILDEFTLPVYSAADARQRETQTTQWLSSLRW
ncbi:ABC transporter ATP-binding protein [Qiania dongpingensis]|uniref:ABC transporter ATP-binding protein n=1 Tax=Qiania dongpingensis TaxID=2763669 RepID=A0A7G9G3C5_9FIRM|nr:ABC transporter ATP-binding protein [Qiania dongpingensis]QNM05307.1 ABC transporter ATP-binding protein [Qiania dongpingensis]